MNKIHPIYDIKYIIKMWLLILLFVGVNSYNCNNDFVSNYDIPEPLWYDKDLCLASYCGWVEGSNKCTHCELYSNSDVLCSSYPGCKYIELIEKCQGEGTTNVTNCTIIGPLLPTNIGFSYYGRNVTSGRLFEIAGNCTDNVEIEVDVFPDNYITVEGNIYALTNISTNISLSADPNNFIFHRGTQQITLTEDNYGEMWVCPGNNGFASQTINGPAFNAWAETMCAQIYQQRAELITVDLTASQQSKAIRLLTIQEATKSFKTSPVPPIAYCMPQSLGFPCDENSIGLNCLAFDGYSTLCTGLNCEYTTQSKICDPNYINPPVTGNNINFTRMKQNSYRDYNAWLCTPQSNDASYLVSTTENINLSTCGNSNLQKAKDVEGVVECRGDVYFFKAVPDKITDDEWTGDIYTINNNILTYLKTLKTTCASLSCSANPWQDGVSSKPSCGGSNDKLYMDHPSFTSWHAETCCASDDDEGWKIAVGVVGGLLGIGLVCFIWYYYFK